MFIVYQNSKERNFSSVDLHFLYKDEAEELLFLLFESVKNSYLANKGKSSFEIEIITGKGKHSRNGAVLMPHLLPILEEQGNKILHRAEGRIVCSIRL